VKILITAGPTREPIDPVRYLTNRSSGIMGYAIAEAAVRSGHHVLLISGPTTLDVPDSVDFIQVETAAEMYEAVASQLPRMGAAIFTAAVADYTPANPAAQKIKKNDAALSLKLVKTRDILGSARDAMGFRGFLIGFAAETENTEVNARLKLEKKGCDLVVANDVSRSDIGFGTQENEAMLIFPERTELFPKASKQKLAELLISLLGD
jgi:phosphopantothenoylcysteine synthetase/decarboxylase